MLFFYFLHLFAMKGGQFQIQLSCKSSHTTHFFVLLWLVKYTYSFFELQTILKGLFCTYLVDNPKQDLNKFLWSVSFYDTGLLKKLTKLNKKEVCRK